MSAEHMATVSTGSLAGLGYAVVTIRIGGSAPYVGVHRRFGTRRSLNRWLTSKQGAYLTATELAT